MLDGPLLRHDVPVRAAGRLARWPTSPPAPSRRTDGTLPADRQQDVDLRRRPRAGREHRPPGARQDPRRRRPGSRASRCSSCRRCWSARTARSASATTSRWPGSTTRWATAAPPTRCSTSARARTRPGGRAGAVGYLVGEPHQRPGVHVPHDERGADRRRPRRDGARLHRLPQVARRTRGRGRRAGRSAPRTRPPPQVPIIEHADVRRMLLAQKSLRRGRAGAGAVLRPAGRRAADRRRPRPTASARACCSTC